MDGGGVEAGEFRHGLIDQQPNLGTAKNHPVDPMLALVIADDVQVGLPARRADLTLHQFIVDDAVDGGAMGLVGYDNLTAATSLDPLPVERLFHGEPCGEQQRSAHPSAPDCACRRVGDVDKWQIGGGLYGVGHQVHGVGGDNDRLSPASFEPARRFDHEVVEVVPLALGLQLRNGCKVHVPEKQRGRIQGAFRGFDLLIEQAVIDRRTLPTHSPDYTQSFHLALRGETRIVGETYAGAERMNIGDPVKAGFDPARLDRLTGWMQRYIDAGKIPFGHVVVSRSGVPIFSSHAGLADIDAGRAYEDDAIVRLYSMTKPITAVAYMQLEEQGLVHLDDPLEKWLPEFADTPVFERVAPRVNSRKPREGSITLHQLLTHTSGLTYGLFAGDLVAGEYVRRQTDFNVHDGPLDAVCQRLAQIPLVHQPGTRWNYGVSIDVIGRVIEVVTGKPLDQVFRENILEPLGMHDTAFQVDPAKRHRLAALYQKTADEKLSLIETGEASDWANPNNPVTCFSGGGGLTGTMADYWKFVDMLRRGGVSADGMRILGAKTVGYMARNHLPSDIASMGVDSFAEVSFHGVGFGLGMYSMLDPAKCGMICSPGEFGWGGLASTVFWVDPVEDVTVVFLTQQVPSSGYPLRRELRALVYGALAESRA